MINFVLSFLMLNFWQFAKMSTKCAFYAPVIFYQMIRAITPLYIFSCFCVDVLLKCPLSNMSICIIYKCFVYNFSFMCMCICISDILSPKSYGGMILDYIKTYRNCFFLYFFYLMFEP